MTNSQKTTSCRRRSKHGRLGERHWKAKLTNVDIEQMRELHEKHGLGPTEIAAKFDVSVNTVKPILYYRRR